MAQGKQHWLSRFFLGKRPEEVKRIEPTVTYRALPKAEPFVPRLTASQRAELRARSEEIRAVKRSTPSRSTSPSRVSSNSDVPLTSQPWWPGVTGSDIGGTRDHGGGGHGGGGHGHGGYTGGHDSGGGFSGGDGGIGSC